MKKKKTEVKILCKCTFMVDYIFTAPSVEHKKLGSVDNFNFYNVKNQYTSCMNERDVLVYAVGSKNAARLSIFFSQCIDVSVFIEKLCQFTHAESTFSPRGKNTA